MHFRLIFFPGSHTLAFSSLEYMETSFLTVNNEICFTEHEPVENFCSHLDIEKYAYTVIQIHQSW